MNYDPLPSGTTEYCFGHLKSNIKYLKSDASSWSNSRASRRSGAASTAGLPINATQPSERLTTSLWNAIVQQSP